MRPPKPWPNPPQINEFCERCGKLVNNIGRCDFCGHINSALPGPEKFDGYFLFENRDDGYFLSPTRSNLENTIREINKSFPELSRTRGYEKIFTYSAEKKKWEFVTPKPRYIEEKKEFVLFWVLDQINYWIDDLWDFEDLGTNSIGPH